MSDESTKRKDDADANRRALATSRHRAVRQLPNVITIGRLVLVFPAGWLLWQGAIIEALILIAIAGVSDGIDGILARRFDWRTRFGAIADPAADKLLVLVVVAVLTVQGHLPVWLVAIIVGRDLVIVGGSLAYRQVLGDFEVSPTFLSKVNTALQIILLALVLIALTGIEPVAGLAAFADPFGFFVVGTSSVLSGVQYVFVWGRRAQLRLGARRRSADRSPTNGGVGDLGGA